MRILFVIDSLGGGGAQRQLVHLATGLKQRGHATAVHTYFRSEWFLPRLEAAGVDYVCVEKRSRFDLAPPRALSDHYRRFAPDVVVAFLRTPSIYAEWLRLTGSRIPLIVSERAGVDLGGLSTADFLAGVGHLLATHITANSHDYLDRLRARLPIKSRSTVLYNGLEPLFFERGEERLASEALAGGRADFSSPAAASPLTQRYCVVAARVTRQKGALPLARALALLQAGSPDQARPAVPVTIDWIGPVDETSDYVRETRQTLAALTGQDGPAAPAAPTPTAPSPIQWNWLGPRQDIDQVYRHYDALLLPSLYEGVANTMTEAMASALPVIVTDIADNRRIVRDGVEGLICAPDDPASLAAAIDRFRQLDLPARQAMGRAAHERARELFSLQALVSGWEALCERVARA